MKLFTKLSVIAIVMAVGTMSMAGIENSKHDFSASGWTGQNGELCINCHTPHGATATTGAPLWNHEITAATFTAYTGFDLDATISGTGETTKLCLSCHDGTVALDSFAGQTGGTNITGAGLIGTSGLNHHPVGFTYDTALATADGGLVNPSAADSWDTGVTIADKVLVGGTQMECSSCHDVHDDLGLGDPGNLLHKSNANSALCTTCHNK